LSRRWLTVSVAAVLSSAGLFASVTSAQAANGTWDRAWGANVNGGGVFGICTAASSCLPGSGGGLGGDVLQPQGVATDSSGNIYVADEDNNRIDKFDSSGNFLRAWGKNVNGGGVFGICTVASSCQAGTSGGLGGEMFFPVGVAIAGGNVYVSDLDRIQEFDSSGNWQRAWGKDVIQAGHTGDTGLGFEICTVAADCKSGETGGTGGAMFNPAGLATDSLGNVYLADEHNSRIQEFNSSGAFLRTWGKDVIQDGHTGDTGTGFEICTVAADCQAGDPDGGGLGGEFGAPSGVAIDSSDTVYVADQVNNRIQKFSSPPSLTFQRAWGKGVNGGSAFGICTVAASCQAGTTGGLGGEMNFPAYLAITGATVYVSDEFNNRIQKFDTSGNWQRAWGKNVNQGGGIFGVCTAASGCCPGTAGHLGGELSDPVGVATDAAGDLYVAEGNRMQEFADSGSTAGGAGPGCTPPTGGGGSSGGGAGPAPSPAPSCKKKKKHKKRAAEAKHKKHKSCKKKKKKH
jgi:DNA-binding beta-propeller fold protein YncE